RKFLNDHPVSVKVEIVSTRGSTPREAGAWMLVSADSIYRTIGGGRLEYMAMEKARELIREGKARGVMDLPLGPEIGQCCGGRVTIQLSTVDPAMAQKLDAREAAERSTMPCVYL